MGNVDVNMFACKSEIATVVIVSIVVDIVYENFVFIIYFLYVSDRN